jgi:tRNA (guanine37-N1)-methyltransferase
MKIDVITVLPKTVDTALSESIIARARKEKILKLNLINLRSFTKDTRRTVDDRPYGGGAGMVMKAQPIYEAIKSVRKKDSFVLLTSARGRVFNHEVAQKLARKRHLIIVCGHYEGVDARIESQADEIISIGDYVLTGGELAAAVMIDCITRLLPGVFKKKEAVKNESFAGNLLEAPHYTRPALWRKKKVPKVLTSGNHGKIALWRNKKSLELTSKLRPDLIKKHINDYLEDE